MTAIEFILQPFQYEKVCRAFNCVLLASGACRVHHHCVVTDADADAV